jgi:hypothetical protein
MMKVSYLPFIEMVSNMDARLHKLVKMPSLVLLKHRETPQQLKMNFYLN